MGTRKVDYWRVLQDLNRASNAVRMLTENKDFVFLTGRASQRYIDLMQIRAFLLAEIALWTEMRRTDTKTSDKDSEPLL